MDLSRPGRSLLSPFRRPLPGTDKQEHSRGRTSRRPTHKQKRADAVMCNIYLFDTQGKLHYVGSIHPFKRNQGSTCTAFSSTTQPIRP